jgi:alkylation response protein AidB-like acyl-CoA dehydrogenase
MTVPVLSTAEALEVARRFAAKFATRAAERDRNGIFPADELAEIGGSGLLALAVSQQVGGGGGSFSDTARVVSIISESDPNIGQILVPHYWGTGLLAQDAWDREIRDEYNRKVAKEGLRWTNGYAELSSTTNVENYTVSLARSDGGWLLKGKKFYCTGSIGAGQMYVTAVVAETREVCLALVPMRTPGVRILNDWDAMGQRTTASGSTIFDNVALPASHVIKSSFLSRPDSVLAGLFPQALLTGVHVGIAKNALADAIAYVRAHRRPWIHSGVERGREDPYAMRTVGQMVTWVEAIDALFERALRALDMAQRNPIPELRAAAMVEIAKAKTLSSDLGLMVCSSLFEVCGSAATLAKHSYDRHWRNLRTISLHDPADYKYRLIGDYFLNDRRPEPSTYT